jgi:signal transduction histidine kinase
VGQIARLLDAEARRHDVALACRLDPALPLVLVDDAQVKQVLMNVVLNGIQAAGPHGRVEITTGFEAGDAGGGSCVVAVADSGPGISPELQDQIFDPFFTTKDAGSGLGLFIARQIVTRHGGRLVPASHPDGGTVFSIHFPVEPRVEGGDGGHA